jgi:hypothetical protein
MNASQFVNLDGFYTELRASPEFLGLPEIRLLVG